MNNPVSAAPPIGGWTGSRAVTEMQALQAGLELARASQLTMLRLQLALHKSNRRTAMQALDRLLDIDAEMEDLSATLDGGAAYLPSGTALSGFIELQKTAIAAEKHILTGGDWRNDTGSIAISAPNDWTDDADSAAQALHSDDEEGYGRTGSSRWMYVFAFAIVVIGIGISLAACLSPTLPGALTSFLDFR